MEGRLKSRPSCYSASVSAGLDVAALLSLAAGYCAVAKQYGKQPAKANAEPYAGPLIT